LGAYLKLEAQIIVVDNGSSDDTGAIARQYPCTVIRQDKKLFPSKARNIGVANSSGAVLVFLDADVEITQRWADELEAQLPSLQGNPAQITGDQYHISQSPTWLEKNWFEPIRSGTARYINGGNLITTRQTYDLLGGFDEQLETGEDVDFCMRGIRAGIPIAFNRNFVAHHEGYPKTVARFLKRERWHGTGDFLSAGRLLNSKVALATLAFLAVHLIFVAAAVSAITTARGAYLPCAAAALIVLLCLASVVQKFPRAGLRARIRALPIVYLYYWGRSLSALDALGGLLRVPASRSR
jgi:glycosyltransferase involved in cell wall biosynthesis